MIIAGIVVGAAGTILTQEMAHAMNRPITNVLFSNFGEDAGGGEEIEGSMKEIQGQDAAIIGEVFEDPLHFVQMETAFGGNRIVDMLTGEQLPRIC